MSVDCTIMGKGRTACVPLVEMFADDELAARWIESVLIADGMDVAAPGGFAAWMASDRGELILAESTVKCHLSSAFSKSGVRSRNEAADVLLQNASRFGLAVSARPATYATTEGSEL